MTVSVKMLAGMQIENANFVGGDLHATIVDLYYPDWNGDLVHIGVLRETATTVSTPTTTSSVGNGGNGNDNVSGSKNTGKNGNSKSNGKNSCTNTRIDSDIKKNKLKKEKRELNSGGNDAVNEEKDKDLDDYGMCPSSPKPSPPSLPFFKIQPRGISTSKSDAVTITIDNLRPGVYLNIIWDAIAQRGSLDMSISGAAHIKSQSHPLGIPLSLGIMCDNKVNLLRYPIQILGRNCVVRNVSTGWAGLTELASEVREGAMKIFTERDKNKDESESEGTVAMDSNANSGTNNDSAGGNVEREKGLETFFKSSEVILDWHDF